MKSASIMDSIKNRLQSAQDGELKTIYEDVRSHASEDAARIDAYIDARIEKFGQTLRAEMAETMETQRVAMQKKMETQRIELKKENRVMLTATIIAWLLVGAFFLLRNPRLLTL